MILKDTDLARLEGMANLREVSMSGETVTSLIREIEVLREMEKAADAARFVVEGEKKTGPFGTIWALLDKPLAKYQALKEAP